MAASLTLTTIAANPSAVNLDTLTGGGVAGGTNLLGFNGADYMLNDRGMQRPRPEGGEQLRYSFFADSGALPVSSYEATGNKASAAGYPSPNYQAFSLDGPNKGIKFNPISSRSKKTLICSFYSESVTSFTVNASFQDGSFASQSLILASGNGDHWWKAEFVGKQENTLMNFEIRSGGAGLFVIQYMYIGVPVAPYRPRGMGI